MKKQLFLFFLTISLVSCYEKNNVSEYPVINVVNSLEKYQRVYCSDMFSSIELIPLETKDECLIGGENLQIILNDDFIFIKDPGIGFVSRENLYGFDHTGKFINEIGRKGNGPGEYTNISYFFINIEKPYIYVVDFTKILEYDFSGRFIRSFPKPKPDDEFLSNIFYTGEDLFISQMSYNGNNRFKYCLFDQNGDTVKTFPSSIFFEKDGSWTSTFHGALYPVRVDKRVYLKDYINDTLYVLINKELQPAYIFSFGNYSMPKESLENRQNRSNNTVTIRNLIGMPNFFFYGVSVPDIFYRPKSKPIHNPLDNGLLPTDGQIYGLYNIAQKTNILLDTDDFFQKGFINDINGGFPFLPKYYAGNNMVVDVWNVIEMKEMLTEEYFSKQTIKNQQAHQKLKELLKILKDDDNPVVVIAKLK